MAILQIPVSKGKDLYIPVDTDELMDANFPVEVYTEILFQGLKQVLNRGFTGQPSAKKMQGKELDGTNAALLEIAQANVEKMRSGEVRISGGRKKVSTKGLDRKVHTEAMRVARLIVKDNLKAAGEKISHYSAKEISAAAEGLLADEDVGAQILEQARETVMAREAAESAAKQASAAIVDISKIKPDPKLVAKAARKVPAATAKGAARHA